MKRKQYHYSDERAVQMLIYMLKEYEIRKIIVSPGATNLNFVASLQYDGYFELYSCPDERSAAYMACGMSVECREPVVITCTGATASREYLAGLTEAFYRKIPIIAVTAAQSAVNMDNLSPQYVDRTVVPKDAVKYSIHIQHIRGTTDEWDCMLKLNRAFHELRRNGGGPIHINLTTSYSNKFDVLTLPKTRVIERFTTDTTFPKINKNIKIGISIGAFWKWSDALSKAIDKFCSKYNAVVLTDHASGYRGKFGIHPTILLAQENNYSTHLIPDLLIHIGEESADYYTYYALMNCKEVWRISEDGKIRDTFRHLSKVFEMPEYVFFERCIQNDVTTEIEEDCTYLNSWKQEIARCSWHEGMFPFSNIWIASVMTRMIPEDSVVHLGLSNTLRSWSFFDFNCGVRSYANVGARGIDGVLSTMIGASISNRNKLFFCILGDLKFFYDLNVLGNRHVGNNIRIIVVNNNGGTEFHLYQHSGFQVMGEEVGKYVAADGHNVEKKDSLIKGYTRALGIKYLSARNKKEFINALNNLMNITDEAALLEVYTSDENESKALKIIRNIMDQKEDRDG